MNFDTQQMTEWALDPRASAEDMESAYTLTLGAPVRTGRTVGALIYGKVSSTADASTGGADRFGIQVSQSAAPLTITFA